MLNYSKKFFLLFLSLYILKPTYAMEMPSNPDSEFKKTITRILNDEISENEWRPLLTSCLQQNADINCKMNKTQDTPLLLAFNEFNKHKNLIYYLLENNANPHIRNEYEHPLLYTAIKDLVKNNLLQDGVDPVPVRGKTGDIPYDREIVEKLLEHKADPNAHIPFGKVIVYTPLTTAIMKPNSDNYASADDLIKLLIQSKADVNERDCKGAPLLRSLKKNDEVTKRLLYEKASLTNLNSNSKDNIFHIIMPSELIRMIITHARFDSCDEKADKNLESTVIAACCSFNRIVPNFPKELQFHIFSYLIESNSLDGFTRKFFRQAVKLGYNFPLINHTNERIFGIKKLLESNGDFEKTPLKTLELMLGSLFIRATIDKNDIPKMKNLLSIENLQKNVDEFDEAYKASNLKHLSENNLKYQIYLNSKNLLLEQ